MVLPQFTTQYSPGQDLPSLNQHPITSCVEGGQATNPYRGVPYARLLLRLRRVSIKGQHNTTDRQKIFTPKYERKLLSGEGEGASAKASAERS